MISACTRLGAFPPYPSTCSRTPDGPTTRNHIQVVVRTNLGLTSGETTCVRSGDRIYDLIKPAADSMKPGQSYLRTYAATGACNIRGGIKISTIAQQRNQIFLTVGGSRGDLAGFFLIFNFVSLQHLFVFVDGKLRGREPFPLGSDIDP